MMKSHIERIREFSNIKKKVITVIPENNGELEANHIKRYLCKQRDIAPLHFPTELTAANKEKIGARTIHSNKVKMIRFLGSQLANGKVFFSKNFVQTMRNLTNKDNKIKLESQLSGFKKKIVSSKVAGRKVSIKYSGKSKDQCDDIVMALAINLWNNRMLLDPV
jgi:hypothetical protein